MEKIYLEALIATLKPSGDVLQVDFGEPAAREIQTYRPKSHTLIVPEIEAAKEAKEWAKKHPNITIIQESWEKVLPLLGFFDTIFFSASPLKQAISHALDHNEGQIALEKGKKLLAMVNEKIPQLANVCYSDQDIEEFYEQVGRFQLKDLSRFLSELKQNGQISEKQYESFIKKYQLEKVEVKKISSLPEKRADPLLPFLQQCLEKHMRKGSRFSSFSIDPTSKYEDPDFFAHIITSPHLEYQEKVISQPFPILTMMVERLS